MTGRLGLTYTHRRPMTNSSTPSDSHLQQPRAADSSLFETITPLIRHWRLVVGLPLLSAVLAAAISLALPLQYTATLTFLPQGESGISLPGGLAGLASEFAIPLSRPGATPDFLADVLQSRELMSQILTAQFSSSNEDSTERESLLDLLHIRGEDSNDRLQRGIRTMHRLVSVEIDRRSDVVTLRVTAPSPTLAAAVANHMVELLNQFDVNRLQSQSRARREFIEGRLQEAKAQLRAAEDEQLTFLRTNRQYQNSPLLVFEQNRLARQVELKQDVFVTLSREYEQARIAEVQNTPVLTIIDTATPPDRKSSPQRTLIVFLSAIGALGVALFLVYLLQYREVAVQGADPHYSALLEATARARQEAKRLFRKTR